MGHLDRPKPDSIPRSVGDLLLYELRKIMQAKELQSKSLEKLAGITAPQLAVLREVARSEYYSVGDIARDVSLSQGTVTGIIERLERRGLILKERSTQDRRRVLVRITDPGRGVLDKALPLMQENFADRFTRLPNWKQTMMLSVVQELAAIMQPERDKRS